MNDTYGPSSPVSSASAGLQRSLENKLRVRMEGYGSPEYALTWKEWDMQSGPPICALRASVRRTSGNDSIGQAGWPTPQERDYKGAPGKGSQERGGHQSSLPATVKTAGWPTPQTFDASNDGKPRALRYKGNAPSEAGNTRNPDTPGSYRGDLKDYAALAEWATPYTYRVHESNKTTGVWYPATMNQADITIQMLGRNTAGSNVGTGASGGYRLNPHFSLWLMGFPTSWGYCGEQVTLSSPRLQRSSFKRSKKQERDD